MLKTIQYLLEASRQAALTGVDMPRVLLWPEEERTATEPLREDIRRQRVHEIALVITFWVLINIVVGFPLDCFHLPNKGTHLV